jgi:hypothetical protein
MGEEWNNEEPAAATGGGAHTLADPDDKRDSTASESADDRMQIDAERGTTTSFPTPSGVDTAMADYASGGMTGAMGDTGTGDFSSSNPGTDFGEGYSMSGATGDTSDAPSSDDRIAEMSRAEDGDGGIISHTGDEDS